MLNFNLKCGLYVQLEVWIVAVAAAPPRKSFAKS